MDITPRHESIANLFGSARIFRVPKYQRHYAWTSEEIDDFIADLDRCLKARKDGKEHLHFFGGLVTVRKQHTGSALKLELIDGQQRLATFVLLVAQLIRSMKELATKMEAAGNAALKQFLDDRATSLHADFLRLNDTIALKVENVARLELSKPDHIFFAQLIEGSDPDDSGRESHRLLKAAYLSIGKHLEKLVDGETHNQHKVTQLANVAKVLESDWTVIHMETTKLSYAYNLFQVLNDRGVGLTEGELLRAKTLELLDGVGTQEDLDRVEASWDAILSEAPERLEDALRWIFASYKGYRPGKTTLFDEFLAHLAPSTPLTTTSAKALVGAVEDLQKDFGKVVLMLDGQWPVSITSTVSSWDRDRLGLLIRELKHTNCMPLLLAATALSQKSFANIVQLLERFVFRYKVVASAHIGPATSLYNHQAILLRASPSKYKLASLRTELKSLLITHASDSRFATNLGELEYSTVASNKAVKYFLMTVEHYARWYADGANGAPVCKDKSRVLDFANTTLEHVHPQKAAAGKSPGIDALSNSLGNLTILGPSDNDAAGNKSFAEKKPILAGSNISLNNKIASVPEWDAASIEAWREELTAMALKIFVV